MQAPAGKVGEERQVGVARREERPGRGVLGGRGRDAGVGGPDGVALGCVNGAGGEGARAEAAAADAEEDVVPWVGLREGVGVVDDVTCAGVGEEDGDEADVVVGDVLPVGRWGGRDVENLGAEDGWSGDGGAGA